jgi:hypothetical protein
VIAVFDGALVGYVRVSPEGQDLALQINALRNHGVANGLIFSDKASGATHGRPGLAPASTEKRLPEVSETRGAALGRIRHTVLWRFLARRGH